MSDTQTAESPTSTQPKTGTSNGKTRGAGTHSRRAAAQPPQAAAPAKSTQDARIKRTPAAATAQTPVATGQHPLTIGLFETFRAPGEKWTLDDTVTWLEAAAASLKLVYKFKGSITVTGTPAA